MPTLQSDMYMWIMFYIEINFPFVFFYFLINKKEFCVIFYDNKDWSFKGQRERITKIAENRAYSITKTYYGGILLERGT